MNKVDSLILGFGYTASVLKPSLQDENIRVISTSRSNEEHILFDLEEPTTWDNIPFSKTTYWTFPAVPLDLVKSFYAEKKECLGQLIVIGSTSAFKISQKNEIVNENTPFNLNLERVRGEKYLQEQGAILVMSSGIYGPFRSPLDWVQSSSVGRSDKIVNMIHVEDLCQILIQAGRLGQRGEIYIASDNNPKTWDEVIDVWVSKKLVKNVPQKESKRESKKIDSSQTLEKLKIRLKHPSFADLDL